MRLLELFAGIHSVGKVATEKGWDVVSVDINEAVGATHTSDILYWDFTQYPEVYFDIVWASPPCTEYSTIMNKRPRKLAEADRIVERTLDIITYFSPTYFFIENPLSGLLKTRECMRDIPFIDVSYCRYGYSYQKDTRVWTNIEPNEPPRKCSGGMCGMVLGGRHIANIEKTKNLDQKYSIPPALVTYLLDHCY